VSSGAALVRWLAPLLTEHVELDRDSLSRILSRHERLIVTISHGGPLSFLPAALAVMQASLAIQPERRIVATLHPVFWRLPGLRSLAAVLSGANEPLSITDLRAAFSSGEQLDYYAFPESEHCAYGDLQTIRPFRFHGFIDIAAGAEIPLLLVAHRGTEDWHLPVRISESAQRALARLPSVLFEQIELNKSNVLLQLKHYQRINIPLPRRRVRLRVACELYETKPLPGRESMSFTRRRHELAEEGERIRQKLQRLYDSLG
jgi:hypothetical protein